MADYIDRDKLLKALKKEFRQNDYIKHDSYFEFKNIVETMPTVDTERHGHWIEELASQHGNAYDGRTWTKYKKYRCSYCRITNGNRRPDYCPHCGAKMRGDG